MRGHLRSVEGDGSGEPGRGSIRVVLADDHVSLRRALRVLLEREDDVQVVAEASDMETATQQVAGHRPDVLVIDLRIPDGSSRERIHRLRARSPRTGIVVITMHESALFAEHALEAGALGVVLKDRADEELAEAVRHAARGLRYTSPRLRRL